MDLIAIVGRPNVGKSTLFNRIIGRKEAIVENVPGVTRDRIYGQTEWNGKHFMLIDTGGFVPGSENMIEKAIREQAYIAIDDADSIIFVCDGRDGVTPFDEDIAKILRRSNKPVTLVVNKCDNANLDANSFEFHKLGLGEPYPVSAMNGRSTGDFLDQAVEPIVGIDDEANDTRLKLAIVGRPNVGKSSITNALTGKERSIVTDIAGTTRDAIDSTVKYYGDEILLIDTAGLRRRAQVSENVEFYSIMRTARAIDRCDVAVVVIDATRGLEDQDKKIINQVDEARKGIVIVYNKWDLVEKDTKTADKLTKKFKEDMKMYDYVPIIYTSAVTKQRLLKIFDICKEIKVRRETRIPTHKLNDIVLAEFEKTPPPAVKGRDLRINYITQVGVEPPVFAFFCNFPQDIPDAYKRFMERTMRKLFDFEGTPISFVFRKKNASWEDIVEARQK
ncbi:MAG: ribosome biogenesis GTPase Der [Candidatus Kapabacteria bacterium]|nr:ribosome biogenesis GTPase Der [Candidatus Kapabacteria bacterium]